MIVAFSSLGCSLGRGFSNVKYSAFEFFILCYMVLIITFLFSTVKFCPQQQYLLFNFSYTVFLLCRAVHSWLNTAAALRPLVRCET